MSGPARKALGEEASHRPGRLRDLEFRAGRPGQNRNHDRHEDRGHEQKAGPGVAEDALMMKLDAVAGGDDDGQSREHQERRGAADR